MIGTILYRQTDKPIPILEMLHFYKGRGLIDIIRYNQTIQTFYTKKLTRLKSIVMIRIVECVCPGLVASC